MKKTLIALLVISAILFCFAAAEGSGVLGQPFPDFTATDTQGNTFTLSEALTTHEAVLINLWATWCPPCEMEFPFLNEAYEAYGDKAAFIALSIEEADSPEIIEKYRQSHGISFPMGRDEAGLYKYLGGNAIPVTVIVDRFGSAVFTHVGSFMAAEDVRLVLEAFLGDGYTETKALTEVPKAASTQAFPIGEKLMIHVENDTVKQVIFRAAGQEEPTIGYVVYDDTAALRLEIGPEDDPSSMIFYNMADIVRLPGLMDTDKNAFIREEPMAAKDDEAFYVCAALIANDGMGPEAYAVYLIPGDECVERLAETFRSWGYDITWEYGEPVAEEAKALEAYRVRVVDQYGEPVAGMMVNFCTDTACVALVAGPDGVITYDGEPAEYHVQLLKAPAGYSFDTDFEMYTPAEYGEWLLRIKKD